MNVNISVMYAPPYFGMVYYHIEGASSAQCLLAKLFVHNIMVK